MERGGKGRILDGGIVLFPFSMFVYIHVSNFEILYLATE